MFWTRVAAKERARTKLVEKRVAEQMNRWRPVVEQLEVGTNLRVTDSAGRSAVSSLRGDHA